MTKAHPIRGIPETLTCGYEPLRLLRQPQSLCIRHTWKEPGSLVTSVGPWINQSCNQPTSRLSGYMSQISPFTIKPFKLGGCSIPYNDGKSCYTYSKVLGPELSSLYTLCNVGIITHTAQKGNLRLREVQSSAQGHTAGSGRASSKVWLLASSCQFL